jgi:hypothetical protein
MDFLTVSDAKPKLGRLMDRVLKDGKPIVIRRGKRFVQLSEYAVPEPIPQRPTGYFAVPETPPNTRGPTVCLPRVLANPNEPPVGNVDDTGRCRRSTRSSIDCDVQ